MTPIAALAAFLACAPAAALPPLPPYAGELGLEAEEGRWSYERRHPSEGRSVKRLLSDEEAGKVAAFLRLLPSDRPEPLLALKARKALEKAGLEPEETVWFAREGGALRLTAAGKNAVVGILLGDPWGSGAPAPSPDAAPPKPKVDPKRVAAALGGLDSAPASAVGFDGRPTRPRAPGAAPVTVYLGWGTSPSAEARGRDIASLYSLYGWSSEKALDAAFGPGQGGGRTAARVAKGLVLDIPLGLVGSFWQHELGHFDEAWRAGAGARWSHPPGTLPLLGMTEVSTEDWERMTPAQRMSFNAGGIFSTQAAAADRRRELLGAASVPWSALPLWAFEKADSTLYNLITPLPGRGDGAADNFDTSQWRDSYAARKGVSPDSVHAQMIAGAVWNALDPTLTWAAASYLYGYLAKGRTEASNPMVSLGPVQGWAGTGFWLSEVGPQYALSLFARDPRGGALGEATVSVGDGGQVAVELRAAELPVSRWTKARAMAAFWMQRPSAEDGDKAPGGAFGVGLDQKAFDGVSVAVDAGYKSRGALLGRAFGEGPFLGLGVKGELP